MNDNVFFDSKSFNTAGQSVTIDQPAYCKSMNWTGTTNTPTFTGYQILSIYGSLILNASMNVTYSGYYGGIYFKSNNPGNTIQTFGKTLSSPITFDGLGGTWTLQDSLTTTGSIGKYNGTLNTNNVTVNAASFYSGGIGALTLGSSVINVSSGWSVSDPNLTFNAGTSTINLTGFNSNFGSDSRTYYNINFTGTGTSTFNPASSVFHNVSFSTDATINGGATYNNLTLGTSKTTSLGGTQTINGTFTCNGTCGVPAALTSGTISKTSGSVAINYVRLQYVTATGGATFTANNTTDFGNNTGWILNLAPSRNIYWIGNTGNWTDAAHWSLTSGGASAGCIPTPYDNVFFNAGSFNDGGKIVTIDQPAYCKSMNWTGVTNTPTLAGDQSLYIYGSLILNASMNVTYSGYYGGIYFKSNNPGNTIQTFGKTLSSPITFDGLGGTWALQDSFTTTSGISQYNCTLNTNNVTINAAYFYIGGIGALTLGSSVINVSSGWNLSDPKP